MLSASPAAPPRVGANGGPQPPGVVARARPLHLDDLGAQVAQEHRRVRPGQHSGQVEHVHSGQWARHRILSVRLAGYGVAAASALADITYTCCSMPAVLAWKAPYGPKVLL